jgi:hypothetical protein
MCLYLSATALCVSLTAGADGDRKQISRSDSKSKDVKVREGKSTSRADKPEANPQEVCPRPSPLFVSCDIAFLSL